MLPAAPWLVPVRSVRTPQGSRGGRSSAGVRSRPFRPDHGEDLQLLGDCPPGGGRPARQPRTPHQCVVTSTVPLGEPRAGCPPGSGPRPDYDSGQARWRPWRSDTHTSSSSGGRLDGRDVRRTSRASSSARTRAAQTSAARSADSMLIEGWIRGPGRWTRSSSATSAGTRAGLHPTISAARACVTHASASAARARASSSTDAAETRTRTRPGPGAPAPAGDEGCPPSAPCPELAAREVAVGALGTASATRRLASAHRSTVLSEQSSRTAASGRDSQPAVRAPHRRRGSPPTRPR